MDNQRQLRDTFIEIDLSKISKNVKLIRDMVGPDVAITAVVKANAYGLGSVALAPTIMEAGATYLAVATLSEAVQLREAYPDYPLFIMGHTPDRLLDLVVQLDICQTIFSYNQAKILSEEATKQGKTAKVHIKVDTGLHRLGKDPSPEYCEEILSMSTLPNLYIEGIFSHLALVDDEENQNQYDKLCSFIKQLESKGLTFKYKHICDSIALVDYTDYHMNMVRPGALIYGMRGFHKGFLPVEPAITFKSAISQIHHIKAGEGVSYDYLWKAKRDSVIATVPFGYADGYPKQMVGKGYVLINGVKAPIIGFLCMDQVMTDVTDVPNVQEGSEVIIYGDGTTDAMSIQEASELMGTNKNDILCRLSARPPRIYK